MYACVRYTRYECTYLAMMSKDRRSSSRWRYLYLYIVCRSLKTHRVGIPRRERPRVESQKFAQGRKRAWISIGGFPSPAANSCHRLSVAKCDEDTLSLCTGCSLGYSSSDFQRSLPVKYYSMVLRLHECVLTFDELRYVYREHRRSRDDICISYIRSPFEDRAGSCPITIILCVFQRTCRRRSRIRAGKTSSARVFASDDNAFIYRAESCDECAKRI